jgi:hypothetical protein
MNMNKNHALFLNPDLLTTIFMITICYVSLYLAWAIGQPSGKGACVEVDSFGWALNLCETTQSALIEYECPDGYYFGKECCEGTWIDSSCPQCRL